MSSRLQFIQSVIEHNQPLMPLTTLLGMRMTSAELGRATFEYDIDAHHANAMGTLHGGILCAIADTAMGTAFFTVLEEHESLTTLELKINYLKPVWKGRLTAQAKVVKRGKMTGLIECDILDESEQLIARASSTYMAISGEQAANRMEPRRPN